MISPSKVSPASSADYQITRAGDIAIMAYADPKVATTSFKIGREKLAAMTDAEVFALWNEPIEARDQFMQDYDHVAVEVPPGHPQVRYFEEGESYSSPTTNCATSPSLKCASRTASHDGSDPQSRVCHPFRRLR